MWKLSVDFLYFLFPFLRNDMGSEEEKMRNPIQCTFLSLLFIMVTTFVMLASVFSTKAGAAMYYISPTGSDSNSGTSSTSPWKTFSFAIPRLQPGYTLILRNGTYTTSNSGFPNFTCGTNANNGTASQRIAIKAENERQAFLSGDGSVVAFQIANCSYWTVDGLRIKSADFNGGTFGEPMVIRNSSNLIVRRMLLTHNNRYKNSHLMGILRTTNSLFEENELYHFHRHAILNYYSNNNTFRRNYFNSRGYADIAGGFPSGTTNRGDAAVAIYPGSNNLTENNISEGNLFALNIEASSTATGNRFFGDISLNDSYGVAFRARGLTAGLMPQNNTITNFVAVTPVHRGAYFRGNKNTRCDNCSFIGGGGGFVADVESGNEGDGVHSAFSDNTLAVTITGNGFQFVNQDTKLVDYANAFNNTTNYAPGTSPTSSKSIDPRLGACKVFLPKDSPMKGAGKNGADIGANVLYRYQNGSLTTQLLWDPVTGEFPHGALISGVNDISGSSALDVHKRLNININGCSLPLSSVPSSPTNLQAQQ